MLSPFVTTEPVRIFIWSGISIVAGNLAQIRSRIGTAFDGTTHDQANDASEKIPATGLSIIKRKSRGSTLSFGPTIPAIISTTATSPKGGTRVNARLAAFRANNNDWDNFGAAAIPSVISDAHSSDVQFPGAERCVRKGQAVISFPTATSSTRNTAESADPSLPPVDLTSDTYRPNPYVRTGNEAAGGGSMGRQTHLRLVRSKIRSQVRLF